MMRKTRLLRVKFSYFVFTGIIIFIYVLVIRIPPLNIPEFTLDVNTTLWFSAKGRNLYYRQPDPQESQRTCKIPSIYPYEPNSINIILEQTRKKLLTPPDCEVKPTALFSTDQISTLLWIGENIQGSDGWIKNGICCYTPYTAKPPNYDLLYDHRCTTIWKRKTFISYEHSNIQVTCYPEGDRIHVTYRDYFHFFRLNNTAEKILNEREFLSEDKRPNKPLSVIYFGLDSVAFTNFQRFLPKTRDFLVRNLSAIEFTGLNKVGRGTMENLLPTLTGCPYVNDQTFFPSDTEECHLVWEEYEAKGYRTVLSEEQFWFPVYQLAKRNSNGTHNTTYDNLAYIKGIQSTSAPALTRFGCFEHQMAPRILSDRVIQVAQKLKGNPYYHHLWSVMTSHDDLGFTKYLDNPLYDMLTNLTSKNLLVDTLLIISSDHGTISSVYSRTPEGLIEARVPLLYFVFPDWFPAKYKLAFNNLEKNSKGLTSPFDVYETLRDLSNLDSIADHVIEKRVRRRKLHTRHGQSLFELMSTSRSCLEAGIPDEYCICWSWTQLKDAKDIRIIKAVSFSLDIMNRVIDENVECTRLDLRKIHEGRKTRNSMGDLIYEVTFETIPGSGIFGSIVKVKDIAGINDLKFDLIGKIERRNVYGNQSSCLSQSEKETGWLRSICYCRGLANKNPAQ